MKHLKIINTLLFFILVIAFISINRRSELPVDGYYKRNEVIIMNNEDRIELKTNVDFLSKEEKYTSIVNISDIYKKNNIAHFLSMVTFTVKMEYFSPRPKKLKKLNKLTSQLCLLLHLHLLSVRYKNLF